VPVRKPVCVGLNTTLIAQPVLAARVVVHVVEETLKSPVVVVTMPVSVTLWLFLRLKAFGKLVVPTVRAA